MLNDTWYFVWALTVVPPVAVSRQGQRLGKGVRRAEKVRVGQLIAQKHDTLPTLRRAKSFGGYIVQGLFAF